MSSTRAFRTVAALLLLASASVATAAAASASETPNTYEHVWQAETLFSGAAGKTDKRVVSSEVVLDEGGGEYAGSVRYHDLLGVATSSGVTSQEAVIDLRLFGTPLDDPGALGGTFEGTVELTVRNVADLAEAVSEAVRDARGTTSAVHVRGHWGARERDDGTLLGELLYEQAEGSAVPVEGVAFFNRADLQDPDRLGEAQTFVAVPLTSGSEGPEHGAAGDDASGGESEALTLGDVFGYILKGITGGPETTEVAVPEDLAAAARRLADATPGGATALPSGAVAIDVDVPGHYLDAKNRAAGLLDIETGYVGPFGAGDRSDAALGSRAEQMRAAVPGIPAVSVDQDAATVWRERAVLLLEPQRELAGVDGVLGEVTQVEAGADSGTVALMRTWYHVATATKSRAFGSVLQSSAALATGVRESELAEGALADAVLVAADAPGAPAGMFDVERFAREVSRDATASPDGELLPNRTLAAAGTRGADGFGLTIATVDGPKRVVSPVWLGYRRADDAVYWLPGEGAEAALTDGSVRGWAFSTERAALVQAQRCGRWLAVLPTGVAR